MFELRQSTAVVVPVGIAVDTAGAVQTALTINQADVLLKKNGGASAQKNDASVSAHDAAGTYNIALNATDTNTLGAVRVLISKSPALPMYTDCMVMTAAEWDYRYQESAMVRGAFAAGSTATVLNTALTGVSNDHYKGRVVVITSGALAGQATSISTSNGTTGALTVAALTAAPANTDRFFIV